MEEVGTNLNTPYVAAFYCECEETFKVSFHTLLDTVRDPKKIYEKYYL